VKLIDDIIEALSSKTGSLSEALLKTKVLLHKIGHKELVDWVNNELNGYPNEDDLPEYRILPAQVLANMANIAYQINSHPIPIGHLSEKHREMYTKAKMNQSLAVLEKLVDKNEGGLQAPIPMEVNGLLSKGLDKSFVIQRAWCEIGIASVDGIFIQVRSRLLDFILDLKDQLGNVMSDKEVKDRSDSIDASSLFHNAIFGDNTTIVVGNNNEQKVSINLEANFHALAENLKQSGVGENEVSQLKAAIANDDDSKEVAEKKFGPRVREWLRVMMSKAIDTSWQIELGVAGNLLTDLLKRYYGWG